MPLWTRRHRWDGRLFPVLALVGLLLLLTPYLLTNLVASVRGLTVWDPKTAFRFSDGTFLDHAIPFVDWSILVYSTNVLFYLALPLAAPRTDGGRRELLVVIQSIVLASWVAFAIFLVSPAHVDLRWQVIEAGGTRGVLGLLYSSIHWMDLPYNSWPSLHVTQTFLVAMGLTRWWTDRGLKLRVLLVWVLWGGIVLSTLTTKQHFLWDVVTGLALGLVAWWFGPRNVCGDSLDG
ncbi:MAG: phosphatase PAP2 family protein [Planctomycetaceae bacterium]|jgi:membrane-associated phospholipid phosphatase|nr:phosphatase PAP2 family protein [Planctomycetaceae bacterium]